MSALTEQYDICQGVPSHLTFCHSLKIYMVLAKLFSLIKNLITNVHWKII